MKKMLISIGLLAVLLTGCGKTNIVKTYEKSENGVTYQFRLELRGRMPNAESDSYYAVLTDNKNLTFEDVSKSLYGSLLEDSKIMEGSIIVEMR